jgi:hypothetical protein
VTAKPTFEAHDDRFHFDELGDDWWATETAWFSFHHPERRLGGWLYTMARPNIGTVAGGVWVWDDSAHLPWDVPYSANYTALPLPADTDLTDTVLPTGVAIRAIRPGQEYELGYADGDRLTLDLRFEGVMAPEPLAAAGSTFGRAHHYDQLGRVTGHLVLHGERIDIDCIGMRDRTWGRRPEDRPRRAAYVTAAVEPGDGFLAVTNIRDGHDTIAYGFLRRDGRTSTLAGGERRVERSPEHGWITSIEIEGADADGRPLHAVGRPVSRMMIDRHTFVDVNSLLRWELDGGEGWGEDQDMWPMHDWSAHRREQRRATEGRPSQERRP